ncbi:MAG: class I SAM-dependent methyltransferase, partial [Candidatus Thermoplasmatota archaeon]|nr:class I SAM-dependent methyltransferase [Candidatus Thermoplasmatota archaeon]
MYVVERIEDREWVMPLYYEHLARFMLKDAELPSRAVVLEAGSGRGNVTLPILSLIERNLAKYMCYDLDEGPYQGCLSELKQKLSVLGLRKVEIMKGDVMDMRQIASGTIDLVIANELLCDLTKEGVNKAMAEFFRV